MNIKKTLLVLPVPFAFALAAGAATLCVEPTGAGGCSQTIQGAIDLAQAGDTIDVYPGDYLEIAANRTVLDGTPEANGPHQFGLFIGQDKNGLTIRGVDARGRVIRDWTKVEAHVTTDSTANFGPDGIFVEGDGVTISGLDIGVNLSGQNKTIEVIGDAFTLADCDVSDLWGSVYFGDWRFDESTGTSHIQSYTISGNNFQDGCSIDLTSGAGFSGPVNGRKITGNTFANSYYWPSISFNGSDTGVPWFVYSVGGAVILGNTFTNTFVHDPLDPNAATYLKTEAHIRARGTYDNSQFNWQTYFRANRYDEAYATGPKPAMELRAYSYPNSYGTFENVRRIGATAEGEADIAEPGDKTLSTR